MAKQPRIVDLIPGPSGIPRDVTGEWAAEANTLLTQLSSGEQEYTSKMILLGDAFVGKTSLVQRYLEDFWTENYKATIGVSFYTRPVIFPRLPSCKLTLAIWDTAGQERFRSLTSAYYRDSSAVIIAFSFDRENSITQTFEWLKQLRAEGVRDCLIFVVACKMESDVDENLQRRAREVAQEMGAEYWETSAKTGLNVNALFDRVAACLLKRSLRESLEDMRQQQLPVAPVILRRTNHPPPPPKKTCCSG
ncbi:putative ras-related protein Rab-36 [Paratrimastix pyriformis]|uniref:Ras-related protein Rab-36 n=1 Tax=Paratrimastix pyriformis TaxID=342808 RepID=A0ABQ8UPF0_9EUKA|nr:putative ras-related protein Rab-36 [Paratrimastix pyriformis]